MRFGISIKKYESMFTNGCVQQGLFIHKMLNFIPNIRCDFVTVEPGYTCFDKLAPIEVTLLTEESIKKYDIIGSLSLTLGENSCKHILHWLKKYKIKYVDILCGNLFVLLQEEFVFQTHHIMKNYRNSAIDEVWVLEMYDYSKEFLELVYNKPVKVLKYVWDTDIIRKYITEKNVVQFKGTDNSKINICVFEANMSLHKNAFVPLLIAERFYRKYPDKLNKVYIFCKENMKNNGYYEHMNIVRNGKIEFVGRMIMPSALQIIQNTNSYRNVVLSYTHMNNLNFLHLELLYLGVPIIHNCEPFQNGYYYNSENVKEAVQLLEKARLSMIRPIDNIEILCKFNCKNADIQTNWKDNIDRICDFEFPPIGTTTLEKA